MIPPSWYREAKHKAPRVWPPNQTYPYDHRAGEFCPAAVESFLQRHVEAGSVLWEPFAGHTSHNQTIDICAALNMRLIAHDIDPTDKRVIKADSTRTGPGCSINGVIFHPPYYGAGCLFSEEPGELAAIENIDGYMQAINKTIDIVDAAMTVGHVCLVARTYRAQGKTIHLDWLLTSAFLSRSYTFVYVECNMPDWIIYLSKG